MFRREARPPCWLRFDLIHAENPASYEAVLRRAIAPRPQLVQEGLLCAACVLGNPGVVRGILDLGVTALRAGSGSISSTRRARPWRDSAVYSFHWLAVHVAF